MFGKRKGPAATPFLHGEDCPTKAAEPEWGYEGNGLWRRVCNCRTEVAYSSDGKLYPNSPATEPSPTAHRHSPSCEGAAIAQVVKVARYVDGGWRSECVLCGTICLYWWNPYASDRLDRPVEREGYIAYRYPLAHETVGV
jgi:hypothetical protein